MLSRADFIEQVIDAYEHLYDLVHLRTHPLANILTPDPSFRRKEKAWQLHHILLDVIEELNPGPEAPVFSPEWSRHRLMVLRYREALNHQAVADQLAISRRHYYRRHKAAIEAIAGILWNRYVVHPLTVQQESPPTEDEEPAFLSHLELLRLEAARMAQTNRYARLGDVVSGVISLLQEMLDEHKLSLTLALPETLPAISIDQGLLRQMLLGTLGYLIKRADQATIRLSAQVEEEEVRVSLMVDPPTAVHPTQQDELQEQLSTFEEMALLSAAQIRPICAGQSIAGFEVHLPASPRRTVLVVDDNEDVLELFQRYLSFHDYRVITARTTQEALALAHQFQPYAITLDLMMPDQDGWDLLQILLNRPDTRHIPIIVCSVLKQKELALSLGAVNFLEKPVTEKTLLSALAVLN